eukprot:g6879.t1
MLGAGWVYGVVFWVLVGKATTVVRRKLRLGRMDVSVESDAGDDLDMSSEAGNETEGEDDASRGGGEDDASRVERAEQLLQLLVAKQQAEDKAAAASNTNKQLSKNLKDANEEASRQKVEYETRLSSLHQERQELLQRAKQAEDALGQQSTNAATHFDEKVQLARELREAREAVARKEMAGKAAREASAAREEAVRAKLVEVSEDLGREQAARAEEAERAGPKLSAAREEATAARVEADGLREHASGLETAMKTLDEELEGVRGELRATRDVSEAQMTKLRDDLARKSARAKEEAKARQNLERELEASEAKVAIKETELLNLKAFLDEGAKEDAATQIAAKDEEVWQLARELGVAREAVVREKMAGRAAREASAAQVEAVRAELLGVKAELRRERAARAKEESEACLLSAKEATERQVELVAEAAAAGDTAAARAAAKEQEVRRLAGELTKAKEAVATAGEATKEALAAQPEAVRAKVELAGAREQRGVKRAAQEESSQNLPGKCGTVSEDLAAVELQREARAAGPAAVAIAVTDGSSGTVSEGAGVADAKETANIMGTKSVDRAGVGASSPPTRFCSPPGVSASCRDPGTSTKGGDGGGGGGGGGGSSGDGVGDERDGGALAPSFSLPNNLPRRGGQALAKQPPTYTASSGSGSNAQGSAAGLEGRDAPSAASGEGSPVQGASGSDGGGKNGSPSLGGKGACSGVAGNRACRPAPQLGNVRSILRAMKNNGRGQGAGGGHKNINASTEKARGGAQGGSGGRAVPSGGGRGGDGRGGRGRGRTGRGGEAGRKSGCGGGGSGGGDDAGGRGGGAVQGASARSSLLTAPTSNPWKNDGRAGHEAQQTPRGVAGQGFANQQDRLCSVNAALQLLRFTPLRSGLDGIPVNASTPTSLAVKLLFEGVENRRRPSAAVLLEQLRVNRAGCFSQSDPTEILSAILDSLKEEVKHQKGKAFGPLKEALSRMTWTLEETLICSNCHQPVKEFRPTTGEVLGVPITKTPRGETGGGGTGHPLTTQMKNVFAPEDSDAAVRCSRCDGSVVSGESPRRLRKTTLASCPSTLFVALNRASCDPKTGRPIKIHDRVTIRTELEMGQFSNKPGEVWYDLEGVIQHHGGSRKGHCKCFIRSTGMWTCYDDARVTQHVDEKSVLNAGALLMCYAKR